MDFDWDIHAGNFLRSLVRPGLPAQYLRADTQRVRSGTYKMYRERRRFCIQKEQRVQKMKEKWYAIRRAPHAAVPASFSWLSAWHCFYRGTSGMTRSSVQVLLQSLSGAASDSVSASVRIYPAPSTRYGVKYDVTYVRTGIGSSSLCSGAHWLSSRKNTSVPVAIIVRCWCLLVQYHNMIRLTGYPGLLLRGWAGPSRQARYLLGS